MAKISYPINIQSIIDSIVGQIKTVLDPEYILITGSFGKGSWICSGNKLLSDFEFVFINNKRWSLTKKKKLLSELNSHYSMGISLKGYILNKVKKKIASNYSSKYPGYISLEYYDTFKTPNILYSKNYKPSDFPYLSNNEIPIWESWRLMVNRLGDLLSLEIDKKNEDANSVIFWLKIIESIVDTFLLIKGFYNPQISFRTMDFLKYGDSINKYFNHNNKYITKLFKSALDARAAHDILLFNPAGIDFKDLIEIVNQWMIYLTDRMFEAEKINSNMDYLKNIKVQNKYLETNFHHNIIFSNILRLLYHSSLLNNKYKFYNLNVSWRHVILLTLASTFKEYSNNDLKFNETKQIIRRIIKSNNFNSLNGVEFLKLVVFYWKMLRF